MLVDEDARRHLRVIFALQKSQAAGKLPNCGSLSAGLGQLIERSGGASSVPVKPATAGLFATATVDIWLRAVHSFLISASLTKASPIWASICGYYSSYYAARALAHMLGYFHLYGRKCLAKLELKGGHSICTFTAGHNAVDREHRLYWKLIRADTHFSSDAFFASRGTKFDGVEAEHRNRANYSDHLYPYPKFEALDIAATVGYVRRISDIEVDTPPLPNLDSFPDVISVQLLAYHRIVRIRQCMDDALSKGNRLWDFHRSPAWAKDVIDFQAVEPSTGTQLSTS